jgi:hypothetical protein
VAVLGGLIFAALAVVVAGFQLGLAAGRPWGHLTMGGRYPGRLPLFMRFSALVFALLWLAMAWLVLAHVRGWAVVQGWGLYSVLGLCLMTTVLNLITPSLPERRLWGPVTVVMSLAMVLVVAL